MRRRPEFTESILVIRADPVHDRDVDKHQVDKTAGRAHMAGHGQSTLTTSSAFPTLAAMVQRRASVAAPDSAGLGSSINGTLATETATRSDYLVLPSHREGMGPLRNSSNYPEDRLWLDAESVNRSFHEGSPLLRRSGLLQPRSFNPASSFSSSTEFPAAQSRAQPMSHSQHTIRMSTVELSGMSFSSVSSAIPPPDPTLQNDAAPPPLTNAINDSLSPPTPEIPTPTISPGPSSPPTPPNTSATTPRAANLPRPSGLTLLRQEYESGSGYTSDSDGSRTPTAPPRSPRVHWTDAGPSVKNSAGSGSGYGSIPSISTSASPVPDYLSLSLPPNPAMTAVSETTPLIRRASPPDPYQTQAQAQRREAPSPVLPLKYASRAAPSVGTHLAKAWDAVPHFLEVSVRSVPAVLLGCLLNILDGVSYGMILFPGTGVFADLGPMGVSMFFLTTVIAQSVYTAGGSGFAGANGSMMIEVVPFFHILATDIAAHIGEEHPAEVVATTLAAFALSSILTGMTFFLLGALKLGVLIGFFPRHILVGFTVSMRIGEDDLGANWETIQTMFLDTHNLTLWAVPLALAVLLRAITHRFHHQLIFPLYFLVIPVLFYVAVAAAGLDLSELRRARWIFDMGSGAAEPWYTFYMRFDPSAIRFGALWATLPTQFALLFFNILHPPLNVPALCTSCFSPFGVKLTAPFVYEAVSLNEDVDTNKELVSHGYSNLLAGFLGTVPNYLVYVNTLLFYRVGGDTRIAGFLLVVMNVVLLVIGTGPIAYIRASPAPPPYLTFC
ncbi:hypothetical protein H0H81_003026 [Sphagnurus paluster]|uniref:SLC26A/SulP transporter domain-containing protein n=1 Tax=Sphagnurus paluster TaxID=117069 RepID=A0A9P7K2F6_9AGAR|nr:hypothetical protein H0H81_003026 [Sphagnurus paluster]